MADSNSDQEKTQPATPKKLQEAREKGDVPRSRELATSLLLLGAVAMMFVGGKNLASSLGIIFSNSFSLSRAEIFDPYFLVNAFLGANIVALQALLPLLLGFVALAIVGPLALGGWAFSAQALGAKWNRLSPIAGLKRVFGRRGLVEMLKAIAKFFVILGFALGALAVEFDVIRGLGLGDLIPDLLRSSDVVFRVFAVTAFATLFISLIDVPFQLWDYQRKHRMSFQEIKDELKQHEGSPETRARISKLQQEMATLRMMEEVPKADVIVINPEHYSVALKFDAETMSAPVVVAVGADLVALRIREIAKQHEVVIVSAPPLARALFHHGDLGKEIPAGLYVAVAKLLAFVFSIDEQAKHKPVEVDYDLPIPESYQV
ncbi:MAG: flagellar biosynthesis protein FlhB [Pseudomonadota bacterium]